MEFTQEFTLLQGVLLSLQKANGELKAVRWSNADSKEVIKKTVEAVKNILQKILSEGDATENEIKLRRIGLFLILNTDLSVQDDFTEDTNYGHLVGAVPTLSRDILMEIFWNTDLKQIFCEPILLCPSAISLELLEQVIEKYKVEPCKSEYPFLVCILSCVYKKILSLTASIDEATHQCHFVCVALKYLDIFSSLFVYFKRSELMNIEEDDIVRQFGCIVMKSFELVITCLEHYLKCKTYSEAIIDMYNISLPFDYKKWHQETSLDVHSRVNELLFANLMEHVAFISVDIWIQWSEFASDVVSDGSVQKDVGELVYKCIAQIKEAEKQGLKCHLIKDLMQMLPSLAIKPVDEDDEIELADVSMILKRIPDKSSTQKKWLKALLRKCDDVISKEECMNCVRDNLCLFDSETCVLLLDRAMAFLKNVEESNELRSSVKILCVDIVEQLPLSEQLLVLHEFLSTHSVNNLLRCDNYETSAIKIFNTLAGERESSLGEKCYSDVLVLSIQDPEDVVRRLVWQAVAADNQAFIIAEIIGVLIPLWKLSISNPTCDGDGSSLLLYALNKLMLDHKDMEFNESSFVSFITKLINGRFLCGKEFSERLLLPLLHKSLLSEDWQDIILWLQIFKVVVDGAMNGENELEPAVLMVLLAQILEKGRKNIFNFSTHALQACERVITLINTFCSCTYKESTLAWLQDRLVSSHSPINLLYFSGLWSNPDSRLKITVKWELLMLHKARLEQFCLTFPETNTLVASRHELIATLIQLLPASTTQEWVRITQNLLDISSPVIAEASSLFVFDLLISSIRIMIDLLGAPSSKAPGTEDNIAACVDNCIRNFGVAVKDVILGSEKTPSALAVCAMFQKFVQVSQKLPPVVQESCSGVILNIEIALITRAIEKLELRIVETKNSEQKHNIHSWRDLLVRTIVIGITMIENCGTRQALSRQFQNKLKDLP